GDKPDFRYFQSAMLWELGKTKEAMLQLEKALKAAPAKMKLFTELNPEFLRRSGVTDLITKYKKQKKS
ncbi:MAG: tetratricopeptide repeat protein, partial [Flavipsychrobacter sp.]